MIVIVIIIIVIAIVIVIFIVIVIIITINFFTLQAGSFDLDVVARLQDETTYGYI